MSDQLLCCQCGAEIVLTRVTTENPMARQGYLDLATGKWYCEVCMTYRNINTFGAELGDLIQGAMVKMGYIAEEYFKAVVSAFASWASGIDWDKLNAAMEQIGKELKWAETNDPRSEARARSRADLQAKRLDARRGQCKAGRNRVTGQDSLRRGQHKS